MTAWIVVEDEPGIYEMLLALTEIMGAEGIAFVNGEDAAGWIEEVDAGMPLEELPQLALLDIRLPGDISGPMVGSRLRQSPVLQNVAVVLITAYHLDAEEERLVIEHADADRLLYKPLPNMNELQKLLRQVVVERQRQS